MRNQSIVNSKVNRHGSLTELCRSVARPFNRITTLQRTLLAALVICLFALAGPGIFAVATSAPSGTLAEPDTKKSFETLKALAGSWEGRVTTVPSVPAMEGKIARVSLRVTSMGNTLMHDLSVSGLKDNPITMFYLEDSQLKLTHYCDAGNRPRMTGKASPDGKTFEFNFLDITGANHYGHMHRAALNVIDANHHTEEWSFMMPGDKTMRAHFDLHRVK